MNKKQKADTDDMLPEYEFDYDKARPNRFAGRISNERVIVLLDPDVSKVFATPEAVNKALRALIEVVPKPMQCKTLRKKIAT